MEAAGPCGAGAVGNELEGRLRMLGVLEDRHGVIGHGHGAPAGIEPDRPFVPHLRSRGVLQLLAGERNVSFSRELHYRYLAVQKFLESTRTVPGHQVRDLAHAGRTILRYLTLEHLHRGHTLVAVDQRLP